MRRRDTYLRRLARRLGYHLVVADHYSPIPEPGELPDDWRNEEPAAMPGVDLRLDESLDFLAEIAEHARAYHPPDDPPGTANGYFRSNNMYGALDAEVLYAVVRHAKPARIVDVGAGFSTLVIEDALAENAKEGSACEHLIFDPYPARRLAGRVEVNPITAQDIPAATFAALDSGDILFIDTTHTVKAGGDVIALLLEVMPSLPSGVLVHIHDFFRPFEYPRRFAELGLYWQEHYLVQAFLAFNDSFEVVLANHALSRQRTAEVEALIPRLPRPAGSALWLRRR